mmetsp:Transcript_40086/g.73793  ORF Transcript_40086/g.73793 Transcript_40086/m.73793 type:complete len:233 (+) Transcript_40086:67-765(+)
MGRGGKHASSINSPTCSSALVLFVIHIFTAAARKACLWNHSVTEASPLQEGKCFITLVEEIADGAKPAKQTFEVDRDDETYCCKFDGEVCCSSENYCCDTCCSMRRVQGWRSGCEDICEPMGTCQTWCVQGFATSSNDSRNLFGREGFVDDLGECGHRFRCCLGVLSEQTEPDVETCGDGFLLLIVIGILVCLVCGLCACAMCCCGYCRCPAPKRTVPQSAAPVVLGTEYVR